MLHLEEFTQRNVEKAPDALEQKSCTVPEFGFTV